MSERVCQAGGDTASGLALACTRPMGHRGEHRDDSCVVDWSEVVTLARQSDGHEIQMVEGRGYCQECAPGKGWQRHNDWSGEPTCPAAVLVHRSPHACWFERGHEGEHQNNFIAWTSYEDIRWRSGVLPAVSDATRKTARRGASAREHPA